MKRLFACFLSACFFALGVFAQTAKVIEFKGEVLVKKAQASSWEKVQIPIFLDAGAQIKTGPDSKCTLIFDDAMKNVLTLKENSQITLLAVKPVNIELPQGKVFALVDDIKKVEKFEIRTPNAVAGVRGTGEAVESNNGSTSVKCFQDTVYVQGLDEQGRLTQERLLNDGFGLDVGMGGLLGEEFILSGRDREEWNGFANDTERSRQEAESQSSQGANEGLKGGSELLEDLKEEQQSNYRDQSSEELRQDTENQPGGGSQGGGNFIK